jgi:hypothetical protein
VAAETQLNSRGKEMARNPSDAGLIGFMRIRSCPGIGKNGVRPKVGKKTSTVKSAIQFHRARRVSERFSRMIPGAQHNASCGRGKLWNAVHPLEDSPAMMFSTFSKSTISVPPGISRKRPLVPENLVETGGWFPADGNISRTSRIIMIRID